MSGFMLLVQNNIGLAYELKQMLDPDGKPIPSFISGDSVTGKKGITIDIFDKENEKIKNDSLHISATKGCELVYQLLSDEDSEVLKDTRGNICRAAVQFRFDNLPIDISGDSSDLFFALSIMTEAFAKDTNNSHFTATGGLEPTTGAVQHVNHISVKFEAACGALETLNGDKFFLYPQSNEKDITHTIIEKAKKLNIALCPLNFWIDGLQLLRVQLNLFAGNPYLKRRPFEVEDHKRFCGREEEIRELLTKLEQTSVLLIIGGSGSGRTSLVQAGLIPSLQKHPLNGIGMAGYHFLRPTDLFSDLPIEPTSDQLFCALKEKLPGNWSHAIENKALQTPPEPIQFAELAASQWQPPKFASDGYWLLAIDPLEEIFSYSRSVVEVFFAFCAEMRNKPDVKIVATLRYDYKKNCRNQLNSTFGKWQEYELKPMDGAQLAAIIKTPAERSHCPPVVFEVKDGKSLVDLIREDIAVPEAMPWLQLALFTLYEHAYARHQQRGEDPNKKQSSIEIRYEDYEAIGKMQGFIVKEANDIFQLLSDDIKKDMPTLMEYLKVGDPVKRRTRDFENNTIQSKINLVNKLIDDRLLVLSLSDLDEVLVTLVHDCLLTYIPKEQKFITKKKNSIPKVEMPIVQQFFKK